MMSRNLGSRSVLPKGLPRFERLRERFEGRDVEAPGDLAKEIFSSWLISQQNPVEPCREDGASGLTYQNVRINWFFLFGMMS